MMESKVSRLRLRRLPYSAAQQPVQCMLQAEVGSSRMAQGTLQFSRAFTSSWVALPFRLALNKKFWKKARRAPGSRS